mgnify:CR=1 FL=1
MTELYKKNGAVFVPVGITLEEVEKLKELNPTEPPTHIKPHPLPLPRREGSDMI